MNFDRTCFHLSSYFEIVLVNFSVMSANNFGAFGPLVGAIDEGTSSARFILFKAGTTEQVAYHQEALSSIFPQEGWVEQDPLKILETVKTCIARTVEQLLSKGGKPNDVVAIGITNQRESTIMWDKTTGQPLHNSIVWLDIRTASTIDRLLDKVPNNARNKNYLKVLCGLPLYPYFSGVKAKWLKDNIPAVEKSLKSGNCMFGTVDTWLIWNLSGGIQGGKHVTDCTNASRTMLMNIETLKWDPFLLNFFDLPENMLPTIKSSSEVLTYMADGPLKGVPIAGCLGDQHAALLGQMCLEKGEAKATYGTGCFLLYNTGPTKVDSAHGLLSTIGYKLGPNKPAIYALEGSVAIAGAALNWLRDNLNILENFQDAERIGREVEAVQSGEVYFVPAFSGLYAPYWQADARGTIAGITEDTTSEHIVRATLEAVCFQIRDILDAMCKDCKIPHRRLKVDGGMTANPLVMQLQADLAGITVVKSAVLQSTALGAAMAAGAAVGYWDIEATSVNLASTIWSPVLNDDQRDVKYSKWKMAVERSLGWAF